MSIKFEFLISFENTEVAFRSKNDRELRKAQFLFRMIGRPTLVKIGKFSTNIARALNIPLKPFLKNNVFEQFCGGENIEDCAQTTKVLDDHNIGTILDFSVEGKEDETAFERSKAEIIKTIETAHNNKHIPFCVFKLTGVARFELLEKVNRGDELGEIEIKEYMRVKNRINEICKLAHDTGTPIFIDAEESWIQDTIDQLALEMMILYNKDRAIIYNTVQLYRWDRLQFLKDSIQTARNKNIFYGVKLVRGAYLEKENLRAEEMNYKSPMQSSKENTDNDFNQALVVCLENIDVVSVCAGSHNESSALQLVDLMKKHNVSKDDPRVYFAQLYGMSDHISFNLSDAGYNVAKYVPYGPIKEVIPYLIRRAEENTSVGGQVGRELSLIQKEVKRRKLKS